MEGVNWNGYFDETDMAYDKSQCQSVLSTWFTLRRKEFSKYQMTW